MNRKIFLFDEFRILTMIAGLATRNKEYPVYDRMVKDRSPLKKYIHKTILEIAQKVEYQKGIMSSDKHAQFIEDTARDISEKFPNHLHNGRLRVGVTQKLINLYLKYLWCAGLVKQPPHCPIDGIIRDKAGLTYNWTSSDCIDDYKKAIEELQTKTNGKTLSEWELEIFNDKEEEFTYAT